MAGPAIQIKTAAGNCAVFAKCHHRDRQTVNRLVVLVMQTISYLGVDTARLRYRCRRLQRQQREEQHEQKDSHASDFKRLAF